MREIEAARCAAHPDRGATGTWERCGAFACDGCFRPRGPLGWLAIDAGGPCLIGYGHR